MQNSNTPEQEEAEDHRLTFDELRKFENLPDDIMFDLTNDEIENIMSHIDSSICLEPMYFPMSHSDLDTQCVGYY